MPVMRLPAIRGVIDRRILVNYRVDAGVMARWLPAPFRPKVVNGYAIAGICLIRLAQIRPAFMPIPCGMGSENAAHRVAVEWDDESGQTRSGVYIPRRDTNSRWNAAAGGRLFPGVHHHARFDVRETADSVAVDLHSDDGQVHVVVVARVSERLPAGSIFRSLDDSSAFFEAGSLGYSATTEPGRYDGLELCCKSWRVQPLAVERVTSSFFEDERTFPQGTVTFDHALLMCGIEHEWHGRQDLCCRS